VNAGDYLSRMVGVRVVAHAGDKRGDSGVIVQLATQDHAYVKWDDDGQTLYMLAHLTPETQALGNVDVIR